MFVSSPADAFLARLLDLVPIYYEAGREIASLSPPTAPPTAAALAGAACSRWLLPAIPGDADAMRPVAAALTEDASPEDLLAFAGDVERVARALADERLATTASHARAAARAAADGDGAGTGRAAADCLYSRGAGAEFVVAEARVVTGGGQPAQM
jgi:hypothetical protein